MDDKRVGQALRDAPVPDEAAAAERGLRVVRAAFGGSEPDRPRPPRLRRLGLALLACTLVFILVLTPVGAEVRDFVEDVVEDEPDPARTLTRVPGGGEILVESAEGPWIVRADGSQRLLGEYEDATWSPQGLFIAVTDKNRITAVEPMGEPRWTVTRPERVHHPAWSPSGYRIAYRAGASLRVVAGDGTGDRLLARRAGRGAPVWKPGSTHVLTYLDAQGRARAVNTDTGAQLFATGPDPSRYALAWSVDSKRLAVVSPSQTLLFDDRGRRLGDMTRPAGARYTSAQFRPGTRRLTVVWRYVKGPRRGSSEVVIASQTRQRLLFSTFGALGDLQWAPDGGRVLISRPAADEWLFLSPSGRASALRAGDIAAQFAPGAIHPSFPDVSGWIQSAR